MEEYLINHLSQYISQEKAKEILADAKPDAIMFAYLAAMGRSTHNNILYLLKNNDPQCITL